MSGPKGYSVSVLNPILNEIFQLQCSIQTQLECLFKYHICDKGRNIEFGCHTFIKSNQNHLNQLLKPFNIKHEGLIDQNLYDKYNQHLQQNRTKLERFFKLIQQEEKLFAERQEDYNAFVSYDELFQRLTENFMAFKTQVIQYLDSYIQEEFYQLFREAKTSIEKIKINIQRERFNFGFRGVESEKKSEIENEIQRCESEINSIRKKICEEVTQDVVRQNLKTSFSLDAQRIAGSNKVTQKIDEKIERIKEFIFSIKDENRCKKYQTQLEKLIQSQSLKDEYYYIELFEEIKAAEKIHRWKAEIQKTIARLNQIKAHNKLKDEKAKILQSALNLMEKEKIKAYEYGDFKNKFKLFNEKNEKKILEEFVKKKERQFIKTQLIQSLENLNYEVMGDMELIDFEKEEDFLFKIPNQSNCLNLRFGPDGSILYNFVIPENRNKLSIDGKLQKLSEMETTCKEFKGLLEDLSLMGLKIDLDKEMPVSEKALIQAPKKYQSIIQERMEQFEEKQIEKKKYLKR